MRYGYDTMAEFKQRMKEDRLYYSAVKNLLKAHYDIFGLINDGLAVDAKLQPIKD
jgi:hypothetical protein